MNQGIRVHCASTTGRRPENQDSCWGKVFSSPKGCVFAAVVLADGMGGEQGGAEASRIAVESVQRKLDEEPLHSELSESWITSVFSEAHNQVVARSKSPELRGMGTTLVLALATRGELVIAHVGDSRAYLMRTGGGIEQLTRDHSAVQDAIDRGVYTLEEALSKPEVCALSSALTRHIGEGGNPTPDIKTIPLVEGSIALICSDGLTGSIVSPVLAAEDLELQVEGTKSLPDATHNLLSVSYQRGSTDNITVALMEIGRYSRKERAVSILPGIPKEQSTKTRSLSGRLGIPLTQVLRTPFTGLCRLSRGVVVGLLGTLFAVGLVAIVWIASNLNGSKNIEPSQRMAIEGSDSVIVQHSDPQSKDSSEKDGAGLWSEPEPAPEIVWFESLSQGSHPKILSMGQHDQDLVFILKNWPEHPTSIELIWAPESYQSVKESLNDTLGAFSPADLGLDPGKYRMKVRSAIADTLIESDEISIEVVTD